MLTASLVLRINLSTIEDYNFCLIGNGSPGGNWKYFRLIKDENPIPKCSKIL